MYGVQDTDKVTIIDINRFGTEMAFPTERMKDWNGFIYTYLH